MKQLARTVAAVVAVVAPAAANPWAQGVSQATQDEANAIFDEANRLFAEQAHAPAAEKYRAALALWDHPLIRFNLAVTLIRLDRPLEAADELERALRYGDAPFKQDLYQSALDYQALLKGRVGHVEASCEQAGANVMLDGKPWFTCPGTQTLRVMAGEHALVGEREGYLTSSRRVFVGGGATVREELRLVPLADAVILEYRYPRWVPYTVAAGGVAIGLAGLATWISARNQMDEFERDYAIVCANGCPKDLTGDPRYDALRDDRDAAERRGTIGVGVMIGGGAVLVGGAVMVILNRPTRRLPRVEVAPTAGGMAASTTWRF